MGWFWADDLTASRLSPQPPSSQPAQNDASPPPGCPMHDMSRPPNVQPTNTPTQCPVGATTPSATQKSSPSSTIAALNPLNYMPSNLSQSPESSTQQIALPTLRETSSIPRSGGNTSPNDNWVYPSPQQMYNALLRKGYKDTPADAVEAMVAVHNFLNEGAWAEIVEWERRFSRGLVHGWRESRWGEEGCVTGAMIAPSNSNNDNVQPRLLRFMGRSNDLTPKARIMQSLGWIAPGYFASPAPFDRHDWFVERKTPDGKGQEVRYVIDYYSGAPEPTGEPVFYLDIRPAVDGPSAAAERLIRWSRDIWWRASGGKARAMQFRD